MNVAGQADVLIIGGGLIGLGIGWQLAKAGRSVVIAERDAPGDAAPTAASYVAAGMLAPIGEAGFDEPALLALGRTSLEMYPGWTAELEGDAGCGIDRRTEGTLIVALDADDTAWLRRHYEFQQRENLPTEWLSGREARRREPHLAPAVVAAVSSPADHQVDPRRMRLALRTAFAAAGGTLIEGHEAIRVEAGDGRASGAWVRKVDEDREPVLLRSRQTVVCAGAWSRLLMRDGLPAAAVPPIRPVKGQVIALRVPELFAMANVIRTRRVYLAPKSDGRLLIGATNEEAGFDTSLTAGATLELLRDAWETVPGIYDLEIDGMYAGLRPAARDNAPVMGKTPLPGLFIATGHYRNGVLLTPVTALRMADLLLTGRVPEEIQPFGLNRFAAP